jgi:predicted DNA-binding transcriptional regulator YafY
MKKFKPLFARLAHIDRLIREGKYPNSSSLAKEWEVSGRTILRDIQYMKDMLDAPIEYHARKRGFYYAEPNYRIPTIDIKESDFFAICVAEKALEQYRGTPLYDRLSGVFDRIRAFLPDTITVNTSWIESHYTFLPDSFTLIDPAVWEAVSAALTGKRELAISHRSPGHEATRRTVRPYHVVNYRGQWYLLAYCTQRGAVLTFAISRISEAAVTAAAYEIPPDFDFKSYMGSHFGIMKDVDEYTVRLRFDPEQAPYIRERVWHDSQSIEEHDDGGLTLSFATNSLVEVVRWVLSHGSHVRVLEPAIVRGRVEDELAGALKSYRG